MSNEQKITDGLQEAVAHARGEQTDTKVTVVTVSDHLKRELLRREFEVAFEDWFRQSYVDSWSKALDPEELAEIAGKVVNKAKKKGLI